MKIKLLRKGSKGIVGTYANAKHHARPCLPMVKFLEKTIKKLGAKEWIQGHNVHKLIFENGVTLVFRPLLTNDHEWGIRINLLSVGSKVENFLIDMLDEKDYDTVNSMLVAISRSVKRDNVYGVRG